MSATIYLSSILITLVLGYMLGRSDGQDEGYLDGRAEMYQEVVESNGMIHKVKR